MEHTKATIEILNDLIEINNDRIIGYEKAIGELKDGDHDLKTLFAGMIDESRQIRMALGKEVQALGGEMESGTSTTEQYQPTAILQAPHRETSTSSLQIKTAEQCLDVALQSLCELQSPLSVQ